MHSYVAIMKGTTRKPGKERNSNRKEFMEMNVRKKEVLGSARCQQLVPGIWAGRHSPLSSVY